MKCNPSKCKELVFRKKRHTDVHIDMISNIPQCSELTVFKDSISSKTVDLISMLKVSLVRPTMFICDKISAEGGV